MDMGEGIEGEDGIFGKSNKETYITICKTANGNLLWGSGNSNRGLCINREGWDGEGDGR